MRLAEHIYRTISSIRGPLLFVEEVSEAMMGEVVRVVYPDGAMREGEVLKIDRDTVLIQVFGETRGLDTEHSAVVFTDAVKKAALSPDIIGRVFNGSFMPIDGMPMFIPRKVKDLAPSALSGSELKRYEDLLDAAVCAYIALYAWHWGPDGYHVYGDMTRGYIVIPMNDWMRERLWSGIPCTQSRSS